MISPNKSKCLCGHSQKLHSELSRNHWNRLNQQLIGYKDSPKSRERFWRKFLVNGVDSDWRCSKCGCQEFRLDNLDYVEKLAKERKLI